MPWISPDSPAILVPAWHMSFNGTEQYQEQRFAGDSALESNSLTGTATYANVLLGGMLNATLGAVRSEMSPNNEPTLGLIGSVNYSREIRRWTVSGLAQLRGGPTDPVSFVPDKYLRLFGQRQPPLRPKNDMDQRGQRLQIRIGRQVGFQKLQPGVFHFGSSELDQRHRGLFRSSGNAILTGSGLVATPVPLPVMMRPPWFSMGDTPIHLRWEPIRCGA